LDYFLGDLLIYNSFPNFEIRSSFASRRLNRSAADLDLQVIGSRVKDDAEYREALSQLASGCLFIHPLIRDKSYYSYLAVSVPSGATSRTALKPFYMANTKSKMDPKNVSKTSSSDKLLFMPTELMYVLPTHYAGLC
jgi:hypothetical protein